MRRALSLPDWAAEAWSEKLNSPVLPSTLTPHFVDTHSLMQDPHGTFAALRSRHPVIQYSEGRVSILRASDVLALMTDARTVQLEGKDFVKVNKIPDGAVATFLGNFFLLANGEPHRMKRGLFARAFAHPRMRAARGEIRAVADVIVADLPRGESFDLVDRMAARVPAEMIARLLGLPKEDAGFFAAHVYSVSRALTPIYPIVAHDEIEQATIELRDYVAGHLSDRLATPRADLLSDIAVSWRDGEMMPFDVLVDQVLGIILGGSDTTRTAFAMIVALLLQNPEQWRAVKDEPALIPGAISEGLRFEPSVGSIPRFAIAPIEIGGVPVPAGLMLALSTLSAMRDPELYADPDRFDIRRKGHPRLHLVFGGGPHRCLGEMLAKLEMEEALASLIAHAPDIELQTPPRMIGFGGIRQITPMQVLIP